MELRTILFGYEKHQFEYFINKNEAAIVRRIFTYFNKKRQLPDAEKWAVFDVCLFVE